MNNLIRNLSISKGPEAYDKIMQNQIGEGTVKSVTESEKIVDDSKEWKSILLTT